MCGGSGLVPSTGVQLLKPIWCRRPDAIGLQPHVLRPLVMADAEEWLAGEDEEQMRWFEFPRPAEPKDVQRFINETTESWRALGNHRHRAIRRVSSNAILSGVDLRVIDGTTVNLSYVVFPPFRRQGIAKSASLMALKYGSEEMRARVAIIKMLPENEASVRFARSLGAQWIRQEPSDAGATFDVYELAIDEVA